MTSDAFGDAGLDWDKPIAIVFPPRAYVAAIRDVDAVRRHFNLNDEERPRPRYPSEPWNWAQVDDGAPFYKMKVAPEQSDWEMFRDPKSGLTIALYQTQWVVFAGSDSLFRMFDSTVESHNADIVVRDQTRSTWASVVDAQTLHVATSVPAEPFFVVTKTITHGDKNPFIAQTLGILLGDKESQKKHRQITKELDTLQIESREHVAAAVNEVLAATRTDDPGFSDNDDGTKLVMQIESLAGLFSALDEARQKELHIEERAALQKKIDQVNKESMKNQMNGLFGSGKLGTGIDTDFGGLIGKPIGESFGSGGLGTRGSGRGGGGTSMGLGGLGTKGIGRGKSGYGTIDLGRGVGKSETSKTKKAPAPAPTTP